MRKFLEIVLCILIILILFETGYFIFAIPKSSLETADIPSSAIQKTPVNPFIGVHNDPEKGTIYTFIGTIQRLPEPQTYQITSVNQQTMIMKINEKTEYWLENKVKNEAGSFNSLAPAPYALENNMKILAQWYENMFQKDRKTFTAWRVIKK